eukprot:CAMPEP_0176253230 /NCGR_PEP_ID=MMETSP0121_2-20121125/35908_1 /TAXON_ID=160619 /ORGANISM="Kryptoperidinium foliaceum, Strain CCMP 1326" /LENGTH=534 /DNA_ID=CAMNT_0017592999 /DNA_START=17 /DNA_END=1619 /DNA_ORIENTATION=+
MTLFYMVNWNDDDIRRYSWQIISSTLSIFVSVLTFGGIEEFIMTAVNEEYKTTALVVGYLLFFAMFLMLQVCIAITSGANCEAEMPDLNQEVWVFADPLIANFNERIKPEHKMLHQKAKKGVVMAEGLELFVRKAMQAREKRERYMKSSATIFAHMTGFAAINMGGYLMHLDYFEGSPGMAFVSVIINQVFLYVLFRATGHARHFFSGLDGSVDERDEIFFEATIEAENDICGLSVSFLIVQVIRYAITGELPTTSGHEPGHAGGHHASVRNKHPVILDHSWLQILALYLVGDLAAMGVARLPALTGDLVQQYPSMARPLALLQTVTGFVSSWCILWASHWLVCSLHLFDALGGPHCMAAKVLLAVGLSAFSVGTIRVLDRVEDAMRGGTGERNVDDVAKAKATQAFTQSAIMSLGILVGFSWEHCFDGGVSALAGLTATPHIAKLGLAAAVAVIVTPAWRDHVVPKEMAYDKLHEEQKVQEDELEESLHLSKNSADNLAAGRSSDYGEMLTGTDELTGEAGAGAALRDAGRPP